MAVIYNEKLNYNNDKNNYDINEKIKRDKEKYSYDLNVVKECSYKSKFVDLDINRKYAEQSLDIDLERVNYLRIYGCIRDSKGNVVPNKRVTLFRAEIINYRTEYVPVCDMVTDDHGIYETVIDSIYEEYHYIVVMAEE